MNEMGNGGDSPRGLGMGQRGWWQGFRGFQDGRSPSWPIPLGNGVPHLFTHSTLSLSNSTCPSILLSEVEGSVPTRGRSSSVGQAAVQ